MRMLVEQDRDSGIEMKTIENHKMSESGSREYLVPLGPRIRI